jgi:hypothetical protein
MVESSINEIFLPVLPTGINISFALNFNPGTVRDVVAKELMKIKKAAESSMIFFMIGYFGLRKLKKET